MIHSNLDEWLLERSTMVKSRRLLNMGIEVLQENGGMLLVGRFKVLQR